MIALPHGKRDALAGSVGGAMDLAIAHLSDRFAA